MSDSPIRIGITMGDFNGVGPELILRTFSDPRINEFFVPVIYGSGKILGYYKKMLNTEVALFNIRNASELHTKKTNMLNLWEEELEIKPGQVTETAGKYALKALDAAIADLKAGTIDALVTAPLNKSTIKLNEGTFTGHTGHIAKAFGQTPLMLLLGDKLKVGLATVHIPLSEVAGKITKDLINGKVKALHNSLVQDFSINKPRIAVLGLNPHAGDAGLLGKEEVDIINPAVEQLRKEGMLVYGAYPADGFFGSGQHRQFDGVLAMYHDQGLIPFKYMYFNEGVNYTAGLSAVRTSPDHGTAYGLAGKGEADVESFQNALFKAVEIVAQRQMNAKLRQNPLKFTPLRRENRFRVEI